MTVKKPAPPAADRVSEKRGVPSVTFGIDHRLWTHVLGSNSRSVSRQPGPAPAPEGSRQSSTGPGQLPKIKLFTSNVSEMSSFPSVCGPFLTNRDGIIFFSAPSLLFQPPSQPQATSTSASR